LSNFVVPVLSEPAKANISRANKRLARTSHPWALIGLTLLLAGSMVMRAVASSCDQCLGTPIAVLAYSYHKGSFDVTTEFRDHPESEISISVAGAEPRELGLVLSDISSCEATDPERPSDRRRLTLSPSVLSSYFPVRTVPELSNAPLYRVTLTRGDGFPIVCHLAKASDNISYDSHIVRFVKPLNVPEGSPMVLSRTDFYRLDQPDIENVRFDDTFGTISSHKDSPIFATISASQNTIPVAENLKGSLVTTAEWTDKADSRRHELLLLALAAALGLGLSCLIEAFRSVIGPEADGTRKPTT
jgi:hypothetical protein